MNVAAEIQVNTLEKIANDLRSSMVGLFGRREDVNEALEYGQELCAAGAGKGEATIAMMVYHNTLLNGVVRQLEKHIEAIKAEAAE